MPTITLKFGKERSLQRFHPWVSSGAIHRYEGEPEDGDRVAVKAANGDPLGWGQYQKGSITVRMLGFGADLPNENFWLESMHLQVFQTDTSNGIPFRNTHKKLCAYCHHLP